MFTVSSHRRDDRQRCAIALNYCAAWQGRIVLVEGGLSFFDLLVDLGEAGDLTRSGSACLSRWLV